MKIAFIMITISILLLSRKIFSMKDAPCAKKSKDKITNANCCIEEDSPEWCPDTSLDVIRENLSKMKSSLRERRRTKKLFAKAKKNFDKEFSNSSPENESFRNDYEMFKSRVSVGGPLKNFWWPFFCHWNKRCCTKCYLKQYSNVMKSNYKGYLHCLWRKCVFVPENLSADSD